MNGCFDFDFSVMDPPQPRFQYRRARTTKGNFREEQNRMCSQG